MLHSEIALLRPAFQVKVEEFLKRCHDDSLLEAAGIQPVVLETLRELPVQMAYAVKARIRSLPEDGRADIDWVRDFFKAAGLGWVPSLAENERASTWTLKSKHLEGLAVDVAPSRDGRNPWWGAPDPAWKRMADISRDCGMSPGYYWDGKKDSPHHEEIT